MKITKIILISFLLIMNSCNKNDDTENINIENNMENILLNKSSLSYETRIKNLNELTKSVLMLKVTEIDNNNKEYQTLINSIASQSKNIFTDLGLTEDILKNNTNQFDRELVYSTFGVALASRHLTLLDDDEIDGLIKDLPTTSLITINGGVLDCLLSATGLSAISSLIDAGYAMYSAEVFAGWAADAAAAFRKAGIQAAKKIITRFAGGFGAIVMVGSFIWCLAN